MDAGGVAWLIIGLTLTLAGYMLFSIDRPFNLVEFIKGFPLRIFVVAVILLVGFLVLRAFLWFITNVI
jgi:hypothetical protein